MSPRRGSADVVAIEDGGSLNWYTGTVLALSINGLLWSPLVPLP
jgi:hypothetical protein